MLAVANAANADADKPTDEDQSVAERSFALQFETDLQVGGSSFFRISCTPLPTIVDPGEAALKQAAEPPGLTTHLNCKLLAVTARCLIIVVVRFFGPADPARRARPAFCKQ